jgi:hypothetical protein
VDGHYIDLSKNKFTELAVARLFKEGLKQNPNSGLIQLNLSCNHIHCGKDVIEKLFKTGKNNVEIDFSGNAILKNSKELLRNHLCFRTTLSAKLTSIFSSKYMIKRDKWIVAIGAKNTLTGNHAFGLVEGIIKNGQRFLFRCDLQADNMIKGNASITTNICNPFDGKYNIDKKSKYIFRIFHNVDKLKANMFKTKMQELENNCEELKFSIIKYSKKNTFNCIKLLVDKIIECDIPTEEEKRILKSWAAQNIPRKGAGGKSGVRCVIM